VDVALHAVVESVASLERLSETTDDQAAATLLLLQVFVEVPPNEPTAREIAARLLSQPALAHLPVLSLWSRQSDRRD